MGEINLSLLSTSPPDRAGGASGREVGGRELCFLSNVGVGVCVCGRVDVGFPVVRCSED